MYFIVRKLVSFQIKHSKMYNLTFDIIKDLTFCYTFQYNLAKFTAKSIYGAKSNAS